jgi:hypothetical protein
MGTRREAVEHPFDTIKNVAFRLDSNIIDISAIRNIVLSYLSC